MMAVLWWIVACGVLMSVPTGLATQPKAEPLSPFLSHYETVDYDLDGLVWHHRRLTRSYMGKREINLQFDALGRSFNLLLHPDSSLFHKDVVVRSSRGPVKGIGLRSSTYSGYDLNEPGSHVHGNMLAGVFDGVVYTDKDIFYIEPAHRYTRDTSAHSIIYRHSDINGETLNGAKCGLGMASIRDEMERATRSVVRGEEGRREDVKEKRQSRDPAKVRCWLNVTGDYKFYEEVTRMVSGGDDVKVSVATSLLVSIIRGASDIFQGTNFDDSADDTADNIQFGVQELVIETEPPPDTSPFAPEFVGVEAFLQHHSDIPSDEVCLSYRFTYRDFDGGVLGLAYVAKQGAAGGICQSRLNTGIVTLLNYGRRVPTAVTTLTMAHEAGHNFGSEHDPETSECAPSNGKYIMYAFATDGTRDNNDEFSPCSRRMMDDIIERRGQSSDGCFVEADDLCRNGLLDEGEDCDCGLRFDEDTMLCDEDRCCNGSSCSLADTAVCSPDQGDCCNPNNCMFYTAGANILCAVETDCGLNTTCDGSSAVCPSPEARMPSGNDTFVLCNDRSATCDGNVCNGSFCEVLSTDSCTCDGDEQVCHVCCVIGGQCVSTIDAAASNATLAAMLPDGEGRFLPVGHPCDDFRGYCDHLQNCFIVDSEGALERLANIFFNADQLNAAIEWIMDHWWAVLVAGVGLMVGIFFIILIVHILLPRPEHVKQRAERRRTIRRNRKQGDVHPDPKHYGHEMRVKH